MVRILYTDISSADDALWEILYARATEERRLRSDRYRSREDSLRCLASDALLRFALGTGDYAVEKNPMGKPRIRDREDIHYNLSHSGPWVVLAWGGSPVGVDVQQHRKNVDMAGIAKRFFAPEEQEYLDLGDGDRTDRFYRIWTGKESFGKQQGTGLSRDLRSFSVLSLPEPLRLQHWRLPDGSTLALCAEEETAPPEQAELRQLV